MKIFNSIVLFILSVLSLLTFFFFKEGPLSNLSYGLNLIYVLVLFSIIPLSLIFLMSFGEIKDNTLKDMYDKAQEKKKIYTHFSRLALIVFLVSMTLQSSFVMFFLTIAFYLVSYLLIQITKETVNKEYTKRNLGKKIKV